MPCALTLASAVRWGVQIEEVEFRVEVSGGGAQSSTSLPEAGRRALEGLQPFFAECFATLLRELRHKAPAS
eukprot:scaffold1277_cov329-Prasinococcus_capsulatus_cf.AAC.7